MFRIAIRADFFFVGLCRQ